MKTLDPFKLSDLEDAFKGKLWCFVPVIDKKTSYSLGVAVANEAGYSRVPCSSCGSWDEAEKLAETENAKREISEEMATMIHASSVAMGKPVSKPAPEFSITEKPTRGRKFMYEWVYENESEFNQHEWDEYRGPPEDGWTLHLVRTVLLTENGKEVDQLESHRYPFEGGKLKKTDDYVSAAYRFPPEKFQKEIERYHAND